MWQAHACAESDAGLVTHWLIKFGLEVAGLAVAVAIVWAALRARRSGAAGRERLVVAAVLTVAVIASGVGNLNTAASELHNAHRSSVGPRRGIDYCLQEDGAQARIPFVEWLRRRLPARAVYALALSGQPDAWCVTVSLLPRLPVGGPNDSPGWLVAFGVIPPALAPLIARHDPSVHVFGPGLALARLGR
jgi:hypothetical protein